MICFKVVGLYLSTHNNVGSTEAPEADCFLIGSKFSLGNTMDVSSCKHRDGVESESDFFRVVYDNFFEENSWKGYTNKNHQINKKNHPYVLKDEVMMAKIIK